MLEWIVLFCFLDGLIAFVGVITLLAGKQFTQRIIPFLVAFSAGVLFSGALFHMVSESLELFSKKLVFSLLILGFILFLIMEKYFHWHHCHELDCKHPVSYLVLLGDAAHNLIDGFVIAASFLVDFGFGVITSVMIFLHEIPQELGDFGLLLYGGFSVKDALLYNFLSQLTCVVGGVFGYFLGSQLVFYLLPLAAGGFLYISASDLIPEIKEKSLSMFPIFLLGILLFAVVL